MTRTKKILVTVAVAAAAALGTAGTAMADTHITVTPQDNHATVITPQDNHAG
ncbi:hypothetical protein [Streptomyces himalayensis]|uniref:Uncharacterized protein n=1 Tax=Streptomyces himalayensis subsp. himalayensis TaxID=2756131 RepID=A0A7W0DL50_9ACTN|nr:hypothetical protein [Streptomyces himalayensis]MBA2947111.1 hypothetical protein [Streptomyces himalayensis subsp. himalayensis]